MKFAEHFKLAVFTGCLVGTLHGLFDIFVRIWIWSFEWFEFYQSLLLSILFFVLFFIGVGVAVDVIRKVFSLKLSKEKYKSIYFSTSIFVLVMFYLFTIVNRDILVKYTFWSTFSMTVNSLIVAPIFAVYVWYLVKGSGIPKRLDNKKLRAVCSNLLFFIVVFLGVSLALDIYLFNSPITVVKDNPDNKPNIILLSLDTIRADHMPVYGYDKDTTPFLSSIAEDSVVFERGHSAAVWTILSHASLFTGKTVASHDPEHTNAGLKQNEITIAEVLRSEGYNTAGFIAGAWIKGKFGFAQGFTNYYDRIAFIEHGLSYDKFSIKGTLNTFVPFVNDFPVIRGLVDTERILSNEKTNERILPWIEKYADEPFFLFAHYIGPHAPYHADKEYMDRLAPGARDYQTLEDSIRETSGNVRYGPVTDDDLEEMISLYDAALAEADAHVSKLFTALEEKGVLENTIVIVTADHGEEFYDHGHFKHGRTLYQEAIHVPFFIYYPSAFDALRVSESVSTLDVYMTLVDYLDIDVSHSTDSYSLMPLISGEGEYKREAVVSEFFGLPGHEADTMTAIIKDNWKLLEVDPSDGVIPSALFDLDVDPREQNNLYDVEVEKREELLGYLP